MPVLTRLNCNLLPVNVLQTETSCFINGLWIIYKGIFYLIYDL